MSRHIRIVVCLTICTPVLAHAQEHTHDDHQFHSMQARGAAVMGVDQYASVHRFDVLPDGGRILFEMRTFDSASVAAIQAHIDSLATAFSSGDFSSPLAVHAEPVPGSATMARLRNVIYYSVSRTALGAELRMQTGHPEGLAAIRDFIDYQNREHN